MTKSKQSYNIEELMGSSIGYHMESSIATAQEKRAEGHTIYFIRDLLIDMAVEEDILLQIRAAGSNTITIDMLGRRAMLDVDKARNFKARVIALLAVEGLAMDVRQDLAIIRGV